MRRLIAAILNRTPRSEYRPRSSVRKNGELPHTVGKIALLHFSLGRLERQSVLVLNSRSEATHVRGAAADRRGLPSPVGCHANRARREQTDTAHCSSNSRARGARRGPYPGSPLQAPASLSRAFRRLAGRVVR